ncbi:hypothetical protein G6F65_018704 [Rhizopus arrhizus]|nr:hypothetical protein G6F65_018704 [Rhizopus arrhizus]
MCCARPWTRQSLSLAARASDRQRREDGPPARAAGPRRAEPVARPGTARNGDDGLAGAGVDPADGRIRAADRAGGDDADPGNESAYPLTGVPPPPGGKRPRSRTRPRVSVILRNGLAVRFAAASTPSPSATARHVTPDIRHARPDSSAGPDTGLRARPGIRAGRTLSPDVPASVCACRTYIATKRLGGGGPPGQLHQYLAQRRPLFFRAEPSRTWSAPTPTAN